MGDPCTVETSSSPSFSVIYRIVVRVVKSSQVYFFLCRRERGRSVPEICASPYFRSSIDVPCQGRELWMEDIFSGRWTGDVWLK